MENRLPFPRIGVGSGENWAQLLVISGDDESSAFAHAFDRKRGLGNLHL